MFFIILIIGAVLSVAVVLTCFADWYFVLEKIMLFMFPHNPITDKEILANREKRENPKYIANKKKWLLRSLTTPVVFALAYTVLYLIFTEMFITFLVALTASFIFLEIMVSRSKKDGQL